jgi:hypothetical protein
MDGFSQSVFIRNLHPDVLVEHEMQTLDGSRALIIEHKVSNLLMPKVLNT